jgi:hypothetical protein
MIDEVLLTDVTAGLTRYMITLVGDNKFSTLFLAKESKNYVRD